MSESGSLRTRIGIDCRKIGDFGIGTYIRGLLRGLASLEVSEEYVAIIPETARSLVPPPFETLVLETPNYTVRELFTLARAVDRSRLDVFHSPHYVLPLNDCPALATIHDLILFHFPPRNPLGRAYVSFMTRRGVRKSAAILSVSQAAKDSVVAELGCPAEKIIVTPNGIDEIFFAPGPAASDLGRYFFFAGNDKPHKNVERLVEAFGRVRRVRRDVRLVLAGAPFRRFAGTDGVLTTGFVSADRLAALYRGAIAVVVPSLEEGFGLPAAEAMAAGAPVIASTAAALVEVTGNAALHVDPLDAGAIATAMLRCAEDEELRADLAAHGAERAKQFTWRRCAELTRKAYLRVATTA